MSPQVIRELEIVWSGRVRIARDQFLDASKTFQETWYEFLGPHQTAATANKISRSRKMELDALREYARVVRIFADLVLRGRIPNED
jgi:hypothetical protein